MLLYIALIYMGWKRSGPWAVGAVVLLGLVVDIALILGMTRENVMVGLLRSSDVWWIVLASVAYGLTVATLTYFLGRGLGWLWRRFVSKAGKPPAPASAAPAPTP